jgi:hypothetical protein
MTDNTRTPWLVRVFWIAAAGNVLLVLIPALNELRHPSGQFSGLAAIFFLLIDLCLAIVIAVVALVRKPWAYAIGLALVCVPAVWFAVNSAALLVGRATAPSIADQDAGRGYFSTPADRALAEAIVAGDAAQVARLAPAANLNTPGWGNMTFMRLAMDHDEPGHAVLAALVRAGLDPDQSSSVMYSQMYMERDEALLRIVIDAGVDLNRHMGHGQWYLFVRYDWPEELALLLDHGADIEVQDGTGYTPLMRAAQVGDWPTVETLRSRGARTDHAGNDGRTLRDLLSEAIARSRDPVPPAITELQASLR